MQDIAQIKIELQSKGTGQLAVMPLEIVDLEHLAWAGDATHLEHVRLSLISPADSINLSVRHANGMVLSKGLLDFGKANDQGDIAQLATHPTLQGLGIGTLLITEMENRILQRGFSTATLGVELINTRALKLYERLGYVGSHTQNQSWNATNDKGDTYLHETQVLLMSKQLR